MKFTSILLNRIRLLVLLLVILNSFFNPQAVNASCEAPGTPEAELSQADAVFTGGVVYISSANSIWIDSITRILLSLGVQPMDINGKILKGLRVVFEVDRSWKGVTTSSVTIRTDYNDWNSSGYPFELEGYYLVYASHAYGDPEKYLLTSLCHRTMRSPNNSEDIAYLNNVPTLELSYFPAIIRTIDGYFIILLFFIAGFIYILRRKRKSS